MWESYLAQKDRAENATAYNQLKQKLREYLQHPSSDGHMIRKQMRAELKELVDIK